MAESLAFIGLIVPGVVIMFGIGALIAVDAISFTAAMAWAVCGAVTGDGMSFWLGRRYHSQLRGFWPFRRYPQSLDQGIAFFEKYGGKSVAFGRFYGPVRAVVPLVAGMLGMPVGRYLIANILSALAWAPAYLLPGMLFGASLKLASEVAFRLVLLIVLLAALGWFSIWLVRKIFLLLHPHARAIVQYILEWSQVHPRMGKIAAALADPNHPEGKGLSVLATLLILTMGLFTLILGTVLEGTILAEIDHQVLQGLQSLRT
ncbi:MAG: DedA family protein, partial [Halobacteria archaeon]|nr:DedA family protein [Halobacteria archaeon]